MNRQRFVLYAALFAAPSVFASPCPSCRAISSPDDPAIQILIPAEADRQLRRETNALQEDLVVRLTRKTHEEGQNVLRSYDLVILKSSTGERVPGFSFNAPVEIELGQWSFLGLEDTRPTGDQWLTLQDIRTVAQAYWFNGAHFIRVPGLTLNNQNQLTLSVRSAGIYQLRVVRPAERFKLARGSPYPRILTPRGRTNRRAFFFIDASDPGDVTGTIYDLMGAKVREFKIGPQSPTPNALVWDGRDEDGNVVPAGPYLYKITSGDDSVSGSLVVAR